MPELNVRVRQRYVDSAGIGELVASHTTTRGQGGELKLLYLTQKIQDLLRITRLLGVFEYFDDEDDAVASFG